MEAPTLTARNDGFKQRRWNHGDRAGARCERSIPGGVGRGESTDRDAGRGADSRQEVDTDSFTFAWEPPPTKQPLVESSPVACTPMVWSPAGRLTTRCMAHAH